MLDPQVIVNLLQQRGHQSALLQGSGRCSNVVSSVFHTCLFSGVGCSKSVCLEVRVVDLNSTNAVPFLNFE